MSSIFVDTQALLHLIGVVLPFVHKAHGQHTPVPCTSNAHVTGQHEWMPG